VREAPVCTDCHGEHRILAHTEPTSPVFAANIPGQTCGGCHSSTRLSQKYGLPLDKVLAFQDSYHGLALRSGQITVANCASCHGVHDIRPSSDPNSHIHPSNRPQTCGKCHPGAGTRFTLGPVHVLPTSNAVPVLFWIRIIYLWIIFVSVGLMALHNILDLVRKARRLEPLPRTEWVEQSERMPRILRWQHGLLMSSFPILVYTGFALTYPESWWAVPLLHWETQLGLRGWLHRASAVVLMGSLLWHLIYLTWSKQLRQKLGGLKLKIQDIYDVIRLQRYNLGVDPYRPRFGKFSYIEKVEYWAFIWGTVLMTLTGLLLWFDNLSLQYLPKWASDVATAIHFYEAILATLAIVVWHFYWVIFDPDVYPMDRAWWHGRSSAARAFERSELEDSTRSLQPEGSRPSDQEPPDDSGPSSAHKKAEGQSGEEN
jgi:cytochrome b subunit of formate dehydrogenase